MCYIKVGRVTPKGNYTNNVTIFILGGVTEGLFIVVLEDKSDGSSYTIGINRELNVIYDCMEAHELKLNHGSLSKCCKLNRNCVKLRYTSEIKDNRVHTKKLK